MSLSKKIRSVMDRADPMGKALGKKLGNDKVVTSDTGNGSASPKGSAGGSGPQTQDLGSQPYKAPTNGTSAMNKARSLTAGARSGVGRLQKMRLK